MNFVVFQQNNNAYMQKNLVFKKYQPRKKLIFQQLAGNFAAFQKNNSVFMQKKIKKAFKKYYS